ncbi:winged helix-turn-helix domain-containing protein [Luteipulveratus mongoliensis]|uniref:winged helix-turn-helix domain-containing protein n=1 Tax=Luteipulveratus mongoliensis TaxID=571913 RepID=UPI000696E7EE|nr:winged helix-turn-helix domain-containing protein [Luteipulveratus mongoliensis]
MRLELSADDLARTRVGGPLGPFAETLLGVASLRMAEPPQVALPWRTLARSPLAHPTRDLARFMCPVPTVQLDTFSCAQPASDVEAGAQAWLHIPRSRLLDEIEATGCRADPSATWMAGLERASRPARQRVTDLVRRVHDMAVGPHWAAIRTALEVERLRLQRLMLTGGLGALLADIHPQARWRAPYLELPTAGRWARTPLEVPLRGHGLTIVPSAFCAVGPMPFFPHTGEPTLLLYPALRQAHNAGLWARSAQTAAHPSSALAAVMGRTRSAALTAIGEGCTTTELAERIDVSTSSASEHAAALRAAGLIHSVRDRNRMVHNVTRLGQDLLDGAR